MSDDIRDFCPRCFASDMSGSWDQTVVGNHCYNCGASPSVRLPDWAVDCIREQASWVGKRYYPNDEDKEMAAELKELRSRMTEFPGRTIEHIDIGQFRQGEQVNVGDGLVNAPTDAANDDNRVCAMFGSP